MAGLPWWAAWLIPFLIRMGAEWVLERWPNLPEPIKAILRKLAQEQAVASTIPDRRQRKSAMRVARKRAAREARVACTGPSCPPKV